MPRRLWERPIDFPDFARWLVLLITGAAACGLAAAQSDTWWHLRAGQDIWRSHQVSLADHYSYTADGRYWPDHEWLWQFLAYGLYRVGGLPLLALINGALAVCAIVVSLPARTSRSAVAALLAVVPVLIGVWAMRPQVASLFLFAVLLRQLRAERWWAVPLVMLLWANVHGAVATGGVVIVAVTAAAVLAALRTRAMGDWKRARALVTVTAVSALATLVTPLGFRLWTYIVDSIGRSKSNHIEEWRSAFQFSFFAIAFWVWVLVAVVVVIWCRRRVSGWAITVDLAAALVLLPFGISAIRNITFFVLAALPLVVALLDRGLPPRADDEVPHGSRILIGVGAVLAIGVVALYVAPPPRLGWQPMAEPAQRAIEACPGATYTTYYGGGYLIWFTPSVKVFVDNRQDPYPSDIVDLGALVPGMAYRPTFRQYDVECAALAAATDDSTRQVLEDEGWTTAFDDGEWSVLRRPASAHR